MSLVAPEIASSRNILKWNNNFSWTYKGEATDSIKERVRKAGGDVTGYMRASLSWFNYDDLDIHVKLPNGERVCYHHKRGGTYCELDVDMNVGSNHFRNAVENITWPQQNDVIEGNYEILIDNYNKRETKDVGFDVGLELAGNIYLFHHPKAVPNGGYIRVVKFEYTKKEGIKFIESLPYEQRSQEVWGISTEKFHKINVIMNSPNHWDREKTGNKHWFFMLDGCINNDTTRGLYNEFLTEELREHRKVFEILGAKLKVQKSDNQLSGVGFSSTKSDSILVKVKGSFDRVVKVKF